MKKILILFSVSLLLFSCSKNFFGKAKVIESRPSQDFVQGSEDIPLLVGMEKISEETVGFDSDAGSIISSSYKTEADLQNVKEFYSKTLPQLGWKAVEKKKDKKTKSIFKRDKEKLEIEFTKEKDKNVVRFFISSAL